MKLIFRLHFCNLIPLLFKGGHNTIQWINNLERELCLSCVGNILEKLDNSTWVFHGKSLSSSLWDASACDFHKSLIILVTLVKQMLHCWAWELVVVVHVVVFGQNLVQEGFAVCCVQCSAMQCCAVHVEKNNWWNIQRRSLQSCFPHRGDQLLHPRCLSSLNRS